MLFKKVNLLKLFTLCGINGSVLPSLIMQPCRLININCMEPTMGSAQGLPVMLALLRVCLYSRWESAVAITTDKIFNSYTIGFHIS